ncbi:Alpha/Beta hydrolase protein, partial [Geopyxis carbonaria]
VPPAKLLKEESFRVTGGLYLIDRWFNVPLDYKRPKCLKIQVFCRTAVGNKADDGGAAGRKLPYISKCADTERAAGGPGFECGPPKSHPLTQFLIGKDFQVLYLDQRGTGLSSAIDHGIMKQMLTGVEDHVEYLKNFRADNIVRDCEAIRQTLLAEKENPDERKWSVIGQSFGGFCAVTYLSLYPQGLKEVFTTGGMPPLVNDPDAVYTRTYRRLAARNEVYYEKYPQDVGAVKFIIWCLENHRADLPSGGVLDADRFLSLGMAFGGHGGIDTVHQIVQRAADELSRFDRMTRKGLMNIEAQQSFDGNPLYALLHEACYCQGAASKWSAERMLDSADARFNQRITTRPDDPIYLTGDPIFFTGEMVYPSFMKSFAALRPFQQVAQRLAECTDWPQLYDVEQLRKNEVPVYAANYIEDMYVDFELASETIRTIRGAKVFETNVLMHNAVRAKTEVVMAELWKLKVGEVD